MIEYPKKLDKIFDKLDKFDIKPVIIGGYVRDYFFSLEKTNVIFESKDIDIELYNAKSFDEVQNILLEFGKPNIIGKNFGVIKLKLDNLEIDFSLPRTENKIATGHSGFEVQTFSNISFYKASSRRDFTINSIGYDVKNRKILDPYNGLEHLKAKKLKIVNKDTFVEDPLRVLRAMGFCARFNLSADEELIKVSSSMCKQNLLDELPRERMYEEFKKLFIKSNKPSIGLNFLKKVDALVYFSELNMPSSDWQNILIYLDNTDKTKLNNTDNLTVMLALLCYKMDKASKHSFLNKLTNKRVILKNIEILHHIDSYLNHHIASIDYFLAKRCELDMLIVYLQAQGISQVLTKKIKKIRPLVNGKDLLGVGMEESSEFKGLLQLIYELQIKKIFS
jgi:tRNA nucleotidyltransferase (CCA-adding enzyme)